ncbi:hypothetical protein UFOVP109_15 [uncultured Caudovirales phage]|uniref:Uncharacterized protein n=1 Tax=uncultured Caudovirales phage TaxID=2100421 RepID=A0A6J7WMW6_9CAUD|nr:hypothetical protein UFOVP109_15 [uncultured Caudovirales phage]CAB5219097.1 hypothetical protein UFOVP224_28 [uncultured Caudovirales phage]
MTQQETLANDATGALDTGLETQAQDTRAYTQAEVDAMMAKTRSAMEKRYAKKYEELGDVEELRALKVQQEQARTQDQIKRGEFEKTLQELASKKDAEIARRDSIIKEYKVNTPLVSAAAKYRAVNADQVKALLMPQVRLNGEGEVEVTDSKGSVRYNDRGEPLSVEEFVGEWLNQNPHFVASGPSTTNTRSSVNNSIDEVDISKLDMKLAEHRKIYAQLKSQKKI